MLVDMSATDLSTLEVPDDAARCWSTLRPECYIFDHRVTVNVAWWRQTFAARGLPNPLVGESISRGDLFALGARAVEDPDAALTLLWNAVAWGSGPSVRNVRARLAAVCADPPHAARVLCDAARRSRTDPAGAYGLLRPEDRRNAIRSLGPAFFTKFLYFAGAGAAEHPCRILDARVAATLRGMGWRSLPRTSPWSASAYQRYNDLLGRWRLAAGIERADVIERWLFERGGG